MEQNPRKRQPPAYQNAAVSADKRPRTTTPPAATVPELTKENSSEVDEESGTAMAWLSMDDETVSELSKLLETEITVPVKVKIVNDPYTSPPLIFQSSSSYVTINGNEESCGSSFSESDCSVMLGIISPGYGNGVGYGGAWDADVEEARGWVEDVALDGSDCFGDDMLAKFLGEDFLRSQ